MKNIKPLHYLIASLCILFFVVACPPNAPPSEGWVEVHNDSDFDLYVIVDDETQNVGQGGTATFTVDFPNNETSRNVDVRWGVSLEILATDTVEAKNGQTVAYYIFGMGPT
jgi:hypothetical protein